MSDLPFCVDCKHHERLGSGAGSHWCLRAEITHLSLVTGETEKMGSLLCHHQRVSTNPADCGPDARHFQPKGEKS